LRTLGLATWGPRLAAGIRTESAVGIDPITLDTLTKMAPGQVLVDEPMARHTSFGLGGPADVFVEPRDAATFRECADYLSKAGVPMTLLGRGTNILVRSGGIDGAVLTGTRAFGTLSRTDEAVRVGGGVGLARLLTFCAENGLSGLEGLSGIPGSAGGAVVTNAGSFGVSIGDRLMGITVSSPGGPPSTIPREKLPMSYRKTEIKSGLFIEEVELALDRGDPEDIVAAHRETLEKKWKSQPSGMRCAGCVFKNPPTDAAGRLIDQAGLKGKRVGGAVVSDLHANFILNDRGATAEDVEDLIEIVRERVAEAAGVTLELEVEIVGRP
jgi:UDP-N-acetylmuramate dehydrogenase